MPSCIELHPEILFISQHGHCLDTYFSSLKWLLTSLNRLSSVDLERLFGFTKNKEGQVLIYLLPLRINKQLYLCTFFFWDFPAVSHSASTWDGSCVRVLRSLSSQYFHFFGQTWLQIVCMFLLIFLPQYSRSYGLAANAHQFFFQQKYIHSGCSVF